MGIDKGLELLTESQFHGGGKYEQCVLYTDSQTNVWTPPPRVRLALEVCQVRYGKRVRVQLMERYNPMRAWVDARSRQARISFEILPILDRLHDVSQRRNALRVQESELQDELCEMMEDLRALLIGQALGEMHSTLE